ncbi:MAG TPA: hypothetical protein VHA57_07630, partial [Actinomycetota bacterium]|nr:hypothetical protein [Actinomycetota bacterium]
MDRDPSSARLVPSLDGRHHARDALLRAVSREGAQVLSNPKRLSTVIDDELAGLPRERALLVKAVEVQVPAIIQGIVKRSGAERAVELAAATLYSLHGRDQDGCLWVAGEMARVLGYPTANNVSIDEWTGQPGARGNGEAETARLGFRPPVAPAPTRPDPAPGP